MDENYNPNAMNNQNATVNNPPQPPIPKAVPQQPYQQQPYQQTPYQQPYQQAVPQQPYQQQPTYQQPPYQQVPQQQFGGAPVQTQVKKKSNGAVIGIIAAVLIIAIVGALFLAGSKPEKKFYGEWSSNQDLTEKFKESFGENAKYLGDDFKYEFTVDFVFNEDNTYKAEINKDSYDKMMSDYKVALKKATIASTRNQYPAFSSYSDEEITALLEASLGKKLDEYIDDSLADYTYEKTAQETNISGNFKVEDNKLFLSNGTDKQIDPNVYAVFEEKSDTEIVITDYLSNGETNDKVFALPSTLIKK